MSETAAYCCGAAAEAAVFRRRETSSMETEPRTLNEEELHSAREAAVDIFLKNEPEEARHIFTKGLQPVRSMEEMKRILHGNWKHYDWEEEREQEQELKEEQEQEQEQELQLEQDQCGICVNDDVLPFPLPVLHLHSFECPRNVRKEIERQSSAPF